MHLTRVVTSALLLLVEAEISSAKAIMHLPNSLRRRTHLEDIVGKQADRILRRTPQMSDMPMNSTSNATTEAIASNCNRVLSTLTKVSNDAGMGACYNIIQYDQSQGLFEADLRLYDMFPATGSFEGVAVTDMMPSVTFPSSTMFQVISKRRKRDLARRQSSTDEIQQYTLFGTFQKNLDLSLLNDTQIMSLMLPTIKLNAIDANRNPITANITAADGAWFVTGQFQNKFQESDVTPTAATLAITAAAPFVLPGTTLGIFPTGLIVTCAWTGLFFLAYGFGTLGRIKYRTAFRRRKAAQAGRTGKRI